MRTTPSPTSGAQNGCHDNAVCLATGPRNLHFMETYFKNDKVYKLEIRHIYSARAPSHDPILREIGDRSQWHNLYF